MGTRVWEIPISTGGNLPRSVECECHVAKEYVMRGYQGNRACGKDYV